MDTTRRESSSDGLLAIAMAPPLAFSGGRIDLCLALPAEGCAGRRPATNINPARGDT
jgi:hypothetical protein